MSDAPSCKDLNCNQVGVREPPVYGWNEDGDWDVVTSDIEPVFKCKVKKPKADGDIWIGRIGYYEQESG